MPMLPMRKLVIRQASHVPEGRRQVSGGLGPGWLFSKVLVLEDHVPALPAAPDPSSCNMVCKLLGESLTWDPRGIQAAGSSLGAPVARSAPAPPAHLGLFLLGWAPEGLPHY